MQRGIFHSFMPSYLLVGLDNLDDLIVNLPPEQFLSLTAIVDRMKKHQFHTKLSQPENTQTEKQMHMLDHCFGKRTGLVSHEQFRPQRNASTQHDTYLLIILPCHTALGKTLFLLPSVTHTVFCWLNYCGISVLTLSVQPLTRLCSTCSITLHLWSDASVLKMTINYSTLPPASLALR